MSSNTLNDWTSGQTIVPAVPNNIHQALNGDFVGRGATGIPTAGQNLGTVAIPWGTVRADSLIIAGSAVDTSSIVSSPNRVVSGVVRSTSGSNLPQFIVPSGAGLSADLDATPTNLVVVINGATVTFIADQTKSGLTAAPSTQNTALVNDVDAADQFDTKRWGEEDHRKVITMDAVGTEISSLVGKWAAFKLAGVTTEYFIGYVNSPTEITNCFRGAFYDPSLAPIKPTAFSNNDTITLMKLSWWFAENDATNIDITYTNPVWSFTSPSAPVTGDYWYDLNTNQWLRYNGGSFDVINRTFIGWTIQDTTNCVAARCEDFYANFSKTNDIILEKMSSEIVQARSVNGSVDVAGTKLVYGYDRPKWNITTDKAASSDMYDAAEQADRVYYLYIKQNGATVISDISPVWRGEKMGRYHRYNTWRCIGWMYNDATSDVVGVSSLCSPAPAIRAEDTTPGLGAVNVQSHRYDAFVYLGADAIAYDDANDASSFVIVDAGVYLVEARDVSSAGNFLSGACVNATVGEKTTTGMAAVPQDRQACVFSATNQTSCGTGANVALKAGDVLYGMVATGATPANDPNSGLRITKLSSYFEGK